MVTTAAGLSHSAVPALAGDGFARLRGLAADGLLLNDTRVSIYRITVGPISTVLPCRSGFLIGSYRAWEATVEPLVDFIRYMPVVAFVPLTILWSGTGDAQKFLIIFIGTFSSRFCW